MVYSALRRYSLIDTTIPEEMREALARAYGVRVFELPKGPEGFSGTTQQVTLPSFALCYCGYGAETLVKFPETDVVRQQIGLSGIAKATVAGKDIAICEDATCITPTNTKTTQHYQPGFAQFVLRFNSSALLQKLAALLGFQPSSQPTFYPAAEFRNPDTHRLRRLVLFVAGELGRDDALPQPVLDELEQAAVAAFLTCNRHSFSHLLTQQPTPVAPWQVKLIEDYIEANWNEAITVERLSAVSNSSARSIFHSFKRARGYSPMDFVKQIRLKQARQLLESADPGVTVTGVALLCLFSNMGHFARDYRAAFGELPSETLNRARGTRLTRL